MKEKILEMLAEKLAALFEMRTVLALAGGIEGPADILYPAIQLLFVHIREQNKSAKLMVGGEFHSLPDLAFLHLAIAHDGVGDVVAAVQPGGDGKAAGHGDTLAQRAGAGINAGGAQTVTVTGQPGVVGVHGVQPVVGEKSLHGQGGVQRRRAVPLGQYDAVAALPRRDGGVKFHDPAAVQHSQYIGDGEAAANMPAAKRANGPDDPDAYIKVNPKS